MTDPIAHRAHPCRACPWRTDTTTRYRFPNLATYAAGTVRDTGGAQLGDDMFACHRSPAGAPELCAGWLAVAGVDHVTVRLALAVGALPGSAVHAGERWPELFGSYAEMAEAHEVES